MADDVTDERSFRLESPTDCDFGIVFALAIESGCLVDRLKGVRVTRGDGFTVRRGTRNGRRVILMESGPGRNSAAKATEALILAHRPRWVVSSGFCGALVPDLALGDLVVAEHLSDAEGHSWNADPITMARWVFDRSAVRLGRMLTVDRIIGSSAEKRVLGEKHDALAVEMESLAVAEACRERAVPFLAVRAVSDAVDDELPADVGRLLAQKSNAGRIGAALGSIWRRPASLKDMFRLHQSAIEASARIAEFLCAAIDREEIC